METRFLEIAYRKFTEGIGLPMRNLTNEVSTYSNRSSRIAPPAKMRERKGKKREIERERCGVNHDDNDRRMFRRKTKFHKPDLLIPSQNRRDFAYHSIDVDLTAISKSPVFLILSHMRILLIDLHAYMRRSLSVNVCWKNCL